MVERTVFAFGVSPYDPDKRMFTKLSATNAEGGPKYMSYVTIATTDFVNIAFLDAHGEADRRYAAAVWKPQHL